MDEGRGATDPAWIPGDDSEEPRLRPRALADFLGQERLKENLSVFVRAAREQIGRASCRERV